MLEDTHKCSHKKSGNFSSYFLLVSVLFPGTSKCLDFLFYHSLIFLSKALDSWEWILSWACRNNAAP